MNINSVYTFIAILLAVNSTAQNTASKIEKITIGVGSCVKCLDESPIKIVEVDYELRYSYYAQFYGEEISLSTGKVSQAFWDLLIKRIEATNLKKFGNDDDSPNLFGSPTIIQINEKDKIKTFYSDVETLEKDIWELFEEVINSAKNLKLEIADPDHYKVSSKALRFLASAEKIEKSSR